MPTEPDPSELLGTIYRRASRIRRQRRRRQAALGLAAVVVLAVPVVIAVTRSGDDGQQVVASQSSETTTTSTSTSTTSTTVATTTTTTTTTLPPVPVEGLPPEFYALVDGRIAAISTDTGEVVRYVTREITPPIDSQLTMPDDGSWIYYSRAYGTGCESAVFRVNTETGAEETVLLNAGMGALSPAISGDGKVLAVHEWRCAEVDVGPPDRDWFVVRNMDTGEVLRSADQWYGRFPGSQALDRTGQRAIYHDPDQPGWYISDLVGESFVSGPEPGECYPIGVAWFDEQTVIAYHECYRTEEARLVVVLDESTLAEVRSLAELPARAAPLAFDVMRRFLLAQVADSSTGRPAHTVVVDLHQGTVVRELPVFEHVIW